MNRNFLVKSFVLVGLMTTVYAPLKAVNPLLAQAPNQEIKNTLAGVSSANPTTGGGYNGNWLCLNNPNSKCAG